MRKFSDQHMEPVTDPNLDRLEQALKATAAAAGGRLQPVPLSAVKPHWRVRLKCQAPLCEYYGICKVCPPDTSGMELFKAALESYSRAYLIIWREPIGDSDTHNRDFSAELKLAEIVNALERNAYQHGFFSAMGLTSGGCKLCPQCTPADEPCRHPFKARPSPEGFGIDITSLAREIGVAIELQPEKTVTFLGLLFV